MLHFIRIFALGVVVSCLFAALPTASGADVSGYSILKGHFMNQTGADTLVTDPDFGFCVLAFIEATDYDLITSATIRFPDESMLEPDDYGDSWGVMDIYDTLAEMNAFWRWGDYSMSFSTVNEGSFTCPLNMPNTALPPMPKLSNFSDAQYLDPTAPFELKWEYSTAPKSNDFVQIYINLGHAEVFSTPNLGEPGALNSESRKLTLPPNTLQYGNPYSLNIEITRMFATNSTSYPDAQGVTGMFSSTSVLITPPWPPLLVVEPSPTNNLFYCNVLADPGRTVVLQSSADLTSWSDCATNVSETLTNLFIISKDTNSSLYFKALQR